MAKKYLKFELQPQRKSVVTDTWEVLSLQGGDKLGRVLFWANWRKYVFQSYMGPIFDPGCLREIADFMEQQTQARKATMVTNPVFD